MVYETKIGDNKVLHKNHFEHLHNAYKEEMSMKPLNIWIKNNSRCFLNLCQTLLNKSCKLEFKKENSIEMTGNFIDQF